MDFIIYISRLKNYQNIISISDAKLRNFIELEIFQYYFYKKKIKTFYLSFCKKSMLQKFQVHWLESFTFFVFESQEKNLIRAHVKYFFKWFLITLSSIT